MAKGISLTLKKGSKWYDITPLVNTIKWSGRKGAAARSLVVTVIDDDAGGHDRLGLKLTDGNCVIFKYDGEELFRGIIMKTNQGNKKTMSFTAYDVGIYLANNRDTFVYKNKTATQIFKDICKRYKLKVGKAASCKHKIPELSKPKTTAYDAICDALAADYEATGTRHYITSEKGNLSLITRKENIKQWVIEVEQNIISYSYEKSIEDIKTRVKVVSKQGKTVASKKNKSLEKKIGIFQEIDSKKDQMKAAQVKSMINTIMKEQGRPKRTLNVETLGIADVISGIGVYIIIPHLGLKRTFYVDSDTHTFKGEVHTMSLTLNYANDI